jgi:hypothetical protein
MLKKRKPFGSVLSLKFTLGIGVCAVAEEMKTVEPGITLDKQTLARMNTNIRGRNMLSALRKLKNAVLHGQLSIIEMQSTPTAMSTAGRNKGEGKKTWGRGKGEGVKAERSRSPN